MQKAYFDSPIGVLEICGDESGVCELNFVCEFICTEVTDANLKLCLSELESYFKGELKTFKTRLNIGGTAFQRCIYENLQKIAYGQRVTYARLAAMTGRPKAFRAAGSANAKNRIPVIVPCHRVVASNGLGGYSGGKGLATKIWLLEHEAKFKDKA